MRLFARAQVAVVLGGTILTLLACGRDRKVAAGAAGPPPDVLKPLQVAPSPYYIIYSPPVNLAKPPDTTAHARKPRS